MTTTNDTQTLRAERDAIEDEIHARCDAHNASTDEAERAKLKAEIREREAAYADLGDRIRAAEAPTLTVTPTPPARLRRVLAGADRGALHAARDERLATMADLRAELQGVMVELSRWAARFADPCDVLGGMEPDAVRDLIERRESLSTREIIVAFELRTIDARIAQLPAVGVEDRGLLRRDGEGA